MKNEPLPGNRDRGTGYSLESWATMSSGMSELNGTVLRWGFWSVVEKAETRGQGAHLITAVKTRYN